MSRFRSILVGIDGSTSGHEALDQAIALALEHESRLTLLAVEPQAVHGALGFVHATIDHQDERLLRESLRRVPTSLPVTTIAAVGTAARSLPPIIEKGDYDLIVVGRSPSGPLRGAFHPEPMLSAALRKTSTSVLVVASEDSTPGRS